MATEIIVRKLYDSLVPIDQVSMDEMESLPPNTEYKAVLSRPRNLAFLRKFFALVKVAFEAWNPDPVFHKGVEVKTPRNRFRKDLTVMAGYFDVVVNVKREVRLEAKSISFAKMSEEEFADLYSKFIDVILGEILMNYTKEDLDFQVEKVLGFT